MNLLREIIKTTSIIIQWEKKIQFFLLPTRGLQSSSRHGPPRFYIIFYYIIIVIIILNGPVRPELIRAKRAPVCLCVQIQNCDDDGSFQLDTGPSSILLLYTRRVLDTRVQGTRPFGSAAISFVLV